MGRRPPRDPRTARVTRSTDHPEARPPSVQQRPLGLTIAALLEGLLGLFLLVLVLPLAGLSALRLALGAAADAELLAAAGIVPFVVAALYTALGLAALGTAWGCRRAKPQPRSGDTIVHVVQPVQDRAGPDWTGRRP